jgi:adenylate cyclase
MTSLSRDELARAAGVDDGVIDRFVAAGVLTPDDADRFDRSAITRTHLVTALVEAGLSLDDLAEAIAEQRLSLDYVELLMSDAVGLVPVPTERRHVAALHLDDRIQSMFATDRKPGDPIRRDDLGIIEIMARAMELGGPPERVIRIVRSLADSAQHIVDLQRDFVDEVLLGPAIEETGSPMAALEATANVRAEYRDLGIRLTELLIRRFVHDAVFKNIVQLTELALAEGAVPRPEDDQSIAFVDISGYTRKAEEAGDAAAAHQAALLADLVRRLAHPRDGRLVRTLGDGAMVHFRHAAPAVEFALEVVEQAEEQGLWSLHAGVNTGPMLRRDADYFGTAVNVASRVADQAGAGEVKVTKAVVDSCTGNPSVAFHPAGEAVLKNVADPVSLFVAVRVPAAANSG